MPVDDDKIAQHGVSCQLGRSFPSMKGRSVRRLPGACPWSIDDYSDVRGCPPDRGRLADVPDENASAHR